jgi:hypothetical protein
LSLPENQNEHYSSILRADPFIVYPYQFMDLEKQKFSSSCSDIDNSGPQPRATDDPEKSSKETIEAPIVNPASPIPPRFVPPDGGKKAWLCVAGAFCCIFVSFGWITCVGTFQSYYQTVALKEYSPQAIAWIPSTEVILKQNILSLEMLTVRIDVHDVRSRPCIRQIIRHVWDPVPPFIRYNLPHSWTPYD